MTQKQIEQWNVMLEVLRRIAGKSKVTNYMTTEQLRRQSEKDSFMDFEETIEMVYDNIQSDAAFACKGIKFYDNFTPSPLTTIEEK